MISNVGNFAKSAVHAGMVAPSGPTRQVKRDFLSVMGAPSHDVSSPGLRNG